MLNIFVVVVCVLLWLTFKDKIKNKAQLVFGYISLAVIIGFCVWSLASLIGAISYPKIFRMLNAALSVIYYLAIGIFVIVVPCKGIAKSKLLFWYVSVPATLAPLLIVTPIGSRCEFAAYVLMICLVADMYSLTKAASVRRYRFRFAECSSASRHSRCFSSSEFSALLLSITKDVSTKLVRISRREKRLLRLKIFRLGNMSGLPIRLKIQCGRLASSSSTVWVMRQSE